jgi:hypothetical protein
MSEKSIKDICLTALFCTLIVCITWYATDDECCPCQVVAEDAGSGK